MYILWYVNISDADSVVGVYESLEDAEAARDYIASRCDFYYDDCNEIYYQHLEIEKVQLNKILNRDWEYYEKHLDKNDNV